MMHFLTKQTRTNPDFSGSGDADGARLQMMRGSLSKDGPKRSHLYLFKRFRRRLLGRGVLYMTEKEAILGLMMGEHIKASLIAGNHLLQIMEGMTGDELRGALSLFSVYLKMIQNEVSLAERVSPQKEWQEIQKSLETGVVMVDSGVVFESSHHLTEALTRATTISNRTMKFLQEKNLV